MTDYINGIKKTGFILEFNIAKILKENGWSIISNRFYEDDLVDTVREIDILAYKAKNKGDIQIYTALIISCKKNEDNVWALLSRDINLNDPNIDCNPFHACTNDIALKEVLKSNTIADKYYKFVYDKKKVEAMKPLTVDVFAFQELNKNTGKPQNDKNIFASLTTLMKAQSYEMGTIEKRNKETKRIYQFNLISVIDSDLIRFHILDDQNITEIPIETEQFVTRYIIKKEQQFFKIRFIKADHFSKYIRSYDDLYMANIKFFAEQRDLFYNKLIEDSSKVNLFINEFTSKIDFNIFIASACKLNLNVIQKNMALVFMTNHLKIFVTEDKEICEALNANKKLKITTERLLREIFKYEGSFMFESDNLPF